jgi:hypothetical protein
MSLMNAGKPMQKQATELCAGDRGNVRQTGLERNGPRACRVTQIPEYKAQNQIKKTSYMRAQATREPVKTRR